MGFIWIVFDISRQEPIVHHVPAIGARVCGGADTHALPPSICCPLYPCILPFLKSHSASYFFGGFSTVSSARRI